MIEEEDGSTVQLSDDQVEEVRRRRAQKETRPLTLEEFDERLWRFEQ